CESPVFLEELIETDALDVLHHDARPEGVVEGRIQEGNRMRMLELGHHPRFATEAVHEPLIVAQALVHDLHDNVAVRIILSGQIDAPHPPFSEEAFRFVSTQKNTTDHGERPAKFETGIHQSSLRFPVMPALQTIAFRLSFSPGNRLDGTICLTSRRTSQG